MTDVSDSPDRSSALKALRDELADEFVRVGAIEAEPRPRRKILSGRRRVVALGVALLLVPASFAVAEALEGDGSVSLEGLPAFEEALEEGGLSWDGENVRMDGEILDCPVDDEFREELGFDPCAIMTPAPAPLNP